MTNREYLTIFLLVGAAATTTAEQPNCHSDQANSAAIEQDSTSTDGAPPDIVSLADSLKPLRDHFNANRGRIRLVALFAPG